MIGLHVFGDSRTEMRLTKEGHVGHVSTLRRITPTGQTTLFEHTITWDMTDAYWVAHADRLPPQEQPR